MFVYAVRPCGIEQLFAFFSPSWTLCLIPNKKKLQQKLELFEVLPPF